MTQWDQFSFFTALADESTTKVQINLFLPLMVLSEILISQIILKIATHSSHNKFLSSCPNLDFERFMFIKFTHEVCYLVFAPCWSFFKDLISQCRTGRNNIMLEMLFWFDEDDIIRKKKKDLGKQFRFPQVFANTFHCFWEREQNNRSRLEIQITEWTKT